MRWSAGWVVVWWLLERLIVCRFVCRSVVGCLGVISNVLNSMILHYLGTRTGSGQVKWQEDVEEQRPLKDEYKL